MLLLTISLSCAKLTYVHLCDRRLSACTSRSRRGVSGIISGSRRVDTIFQEILPHDAIMFRNSLSYGVFIHPNNLMGENPHFSPICEPKSTLWAPPFHNAREIEKWIGVARLERPYQTRWVSHHPRLTSVVPLGHWMGQVNGRIDINFRCIWQLATRCLILGVRFRLNLPTTRTACANFPTGVELADDTTALVINWVELRRLPNTQRTHAPENTMAATLFAASAYHSYAPGGVGIAKRVFCPWWPWPLTPNSNSGEIFIQCT